MNQEDQDFKRSLEAEYGTAKHDKADQLFDLAWEYGHACGYDEVRSYYEDMVALLSNEERTRL